MNIRSPEVHHLKPLDGVRGLAILAVMLSHSFESNYQTGSLPIRMIGNLFGAGRFGVDLFFVLSGFLITGILIDTRHDPFFFRRFFGRRALRILPLYYGSLFVLLALSVPFHWQWSGMAIPLLTYLQNWWPLTMNNLAVGPGIGLYHFWSLAIEEQFYLLWPFVIYFMRERKTAILYATILGSLSVLLLRLLLIHQGVPYLFIHTNLFTRADSLLLGGLLAVAFRSNTAWPATLRHAPTVFLTGVALVSGRALFFASKSFLYWDAGVHYTILAIACAALLAWSLKPRSLPKAIFEQPWLRTLGKYSYGLYVLHVFLLSGLNIPLRRVMFNATGSKLLSVVIAGLLCLVLSMLAAWLSFQLYEKQFLRLKHHFDYTTVEPARISPAK